MTLAACAEIVRRGDPDRFLCAMAAPPEDRTVLFPIHALNVEVARAPWVASEPLLAHMRLQWWADALEEIAQGGPVRRHEVTDPLAAVLPAAAATVLRDVVEARRRDVDNPSFASVADLADWIAQVSGGSMWAVALALGADPAHETSVRRIGAAQGVAAWLLAVPALVAAGRAPLPEPRDDTIDRLCRDALAVPGPPRDKAARIAALPMRLARPVLRRALREPGRVQGDRLALSEGHKRLALLPALLRL